MKTTCFTSLTALLLAVSAPAFTLDFTGNVGANLPPNLVINVPGYGNVEFSPMAASSLVVGTAYQSGGLPTPSLQFDNGEIVLVTFQAWPVGAGDVAFDFIDVSPGESMNVNTAGANAFTVQLTGGTNGAGLQEITFTAVPESSVAALGLLAVGLLARRRR